MMEQLITGPQGPIYTIGPAVPGLDEGFYRGYRDAHETTLLLAAVDTASADQARLAAQQIAQLSHQQIIGLRDVGRMDHYFFVVLDRPAERPLPDLIYHHTLSTVAMLDLLIQATTIVQALHAEGVVWGHFRPHAFWISKAGQLTLADLRGAGQPVARATLSFAEASYLAPETSAGHQPSVQSDIYACGAFAYELFAGRGMFVGTSPADIAVQHVSAHPINLASLRPDLPHDLVALIHRCLAKDATARVQSAAELCEELQRVHALVAADAQAQMIACPRCHEPVPAAQRCPLCNAPLVAAAAPLSQRSRKRWRLPWLSVGLVLLSLACTVNGVISRQPRTLSASSERPIVAPTPTLPSAATATPIPTATAVAFASGGIQDPADDVADPNIDVIELQSTVSPRSITLRLIVAGRIYQRPNESTYKIFLDTAPTTGDTSTPWPNLAPDYVVIYNSGDQTSMVLQWQSGTWHGIGAAQTEIVDGGLQLHIPTSWIASPATLQYGVLATNLEANLFDYAPAVQQ